MKINKQFIFSIFVVVMMITWAVGMALSYNIDIGPTGMKIENVYNELLTGKEKVTILRSGRVLIEYMYTSGDIESLEKGAIYESFVSRFNGLVVLQTLEVPFDNQTANQMIVPTGDIISLENVSETELFDVFCDNTYVQPKECLLRSI